MISYCKATLFIVLCYSKNSQLDTKKTLKIKLIIAQNMSDAVLGIWIHDPKRHALLEKYLCETVLVTEQRKS